VALFFFVCSALGFGFYSAFGFGFGGYVWIEVEGRMTDYKLITYRPAGS